MKIRSLRSMGDSAFGSLRRFPGVIAASIVAAVSAIIATNESPSTEYLWRVVMSAQLGIPLLLALGLANERFSPPARFRRNGILASLAGVLALVIYYFSLPTPVGESDSIRFIQWNVAAHLLVAFLPYLRRPEINGFWQYNLGLALRLLASVFFTAVLFGGLSVALLALDQLLGLEVGDKVYLRLWISLVFVFNTWYFLGGVPSDWRELEARENFPKIVQVFGQHILSPLVIVYQAILTAYLVKIIVTTVWPSSWIGWLVSSVAVAGHLSLLLIHPKTRAGTSRWISIYGRAFHIALLPAVVMLLMAIGQRIGQYGVTEMRYLLAVLAVWLGVMAVLGSIRGRISIRTIPVTLFVLAVLTTVGPLSASAVSRRSQLARLDSLLAAYDRLADGIIVSNESPMPDKESGEVAGALTYLFRHHGPKVLESRCDEVLRGELAESTDQDDSRYARSSRLGRVVTGYANLRFMAPQVADELRQMIFWKEEGPSATDIRGYDYCVTLSKGEREDNTFSIADAEYGFEMGAGDTSVVLKREDLEIETIDLVPMFMALVEYQRLNETLRVPAALMEVETGDDALGVKLVFSRVVLIGTGDKRKAGPMDGRAFVRLGENPAN